MDVLNLHITVLHTESDRWCEVCGLPSAITVIYVIDRGDTPPRALYRLTYCESCDDR